MILTDYLLCERSLQWDLAKQCGVTHAVIRLPETKSFDVTNEKHWETVYNRFANFGLKPIIVEPMPNDLHEHIKIGDDKRDESIEKVIQMLPLMAKFGIRMICFNWMAHIGWLRTAYDIKERGDASVTGFRRSDFQAADKQITAAALWDNYFYFLKAVLPHAEQHEVRLALHPDDPPLKHLGTVSRIMVSADNIRKAMHTVKSACLGLTMCQASFHLMEEDVYKLIPEFAEKIFFIHFRNVIGNVCDFHESFHDNGDLDMGALIQLYRQHRINVPIRADHVPTMASDRNDLPGYSTTGRLFAIGYIKGLIEAASKTDIGEGLC